MTSLLTDDRLFEMKGEPSSAPMRAPAGATKTFRHYAPTQWFLLPLSLDDWLPQDHTGRFIAEIVDELLDFSVILDS